MRLFGSPDLLYIGLTVCTYGLVMSGLACPKRNGPFLDMRRFFTKPTRRKRKSGV